MDSFAKTVMGVFKDFGADKVPHKVRLTKIGCVDERPLKISVGQIIEGTLTSEVKIGLSFNIENAMVIEGNSPIKNIAKGDKYELYCTSIIQEILPDNTFKTKNSIYKFEILK